MRKYILALILGIGIVFQGQSVYAQVEDIDSDNTLATQTIDKNILADEKLMKTITPEQLEEYIAQGADVNVEGKDHVTPLMLAARYNKNPEIIEIILKQDVDVNATDSGDAWSPLMYAACYNSNPEVIKTLLKYNADINAKDDLECSPLMLAVRYNENPEIIEVLLENEADVNVKSENGKTALMYAANRYNDENNKIVELLLRYGANVNAKDNNGRTPLLYALMKKYTKIAKTLINKGASVDAKDTNGVTALHIASGLTPEMFRMVIERSADVDAQMSPDGITPLMFATLVKNPEIVEMLLKHGANTEIKDNNGETALIYAIKQNSEEIIEMLIKSGANVNAKSSTGNSLLYWAIRENGENDTISKKIVETLLDYDAVPNDEELVPILKSDYLDDALKDKIYNVWKEQNITKTKKEKLNNLTDSISMLISTISTLYSNQDSYKNLRAQKVDEYASSPDYKKYDMTIKPADALKKGDNKAFSLKINKLSKDICTYIATIKWWTNDIKFGTPKLGKYQNTPLTIENAKKACECEYNKCSVFIKVNDK